jgi:SAM-dependent methyltransferase
MGLRSALKATATSLVPQSVRETCLDLYYLAIDDGRRVFVRQDPLVPPKRLLRISTDPNIDFRESGRTLLTFLIQHCSLRPDHTVLDVGCGVGRLAVALTGYLDGAGRYEGFDIVPEEIAWCQKHITTRFPNFTFQLANVRNSTYNPSGRLRASEHHFPFGDDRFDVVVLASVFTHMFSDEVEHYLTEVARVLKRGGRCFLSFYLLNEQSRQGIEAGTSTFNFRNERGECRVQSAVNPELAVAHAEDRLRTLFERRHLSIDEVLYGTWSSHTTQEQDLIVVHKR